MDNFYISEIFWSAQGEGERVGIPSVFLRMAGCSLKCDYCDTKYSWKNGSIFALDEILDKIEELMIKNPGISQVVITGGEPLEQDISPIINLLRKKKIFVAIETNGIHNIKTDVDWLTVSPKDVNGYKVNPLIYKKINEIKLIVNKNLTVKIVKDFYSSVKNIPIFLQPQHFEELRFKNTYEFYSECIIKGIKSVKLGFQMQNFYGIK